MSSIMLHPNLFSLPRLAAEERAHDLQRLVDETFQQFGLDDSEDDSFGNCSEPSDPGSTGESLGLINN